MGNYFLDTMYAHKVKIKLRIHGPTLYHCTIIFIHIKSLYLILVSREEIFLTNPRYICMYWIIFKLFFFLFIYLQCDRQCQFLIARIGGKHEEKQVGNFALLSKFNYGFARNTITSRLM